MLRQPKISSQKKRHNPNRNLLIAGLLSLGLSGQSLAATNSETNPWTAGGGFVAGAVIAGPVGAVIGAWAGDLIGKQERREAALAEHSQHSGTEATQDVIPLYTVHSPIEIDFATDAAQPEQGIETLLTTLAEQLQQHPDWQLVVETHADIRGQAHYNQALSEQRATALKHQLVAAGLEAERIELRAFGELKASAGIDDPAGLLRDRRARLYLNSTSKEALAYHF